MTSRYIQHVLASATAAKSNTFPDQESPLTGFHILCCKCRMQTIPTSTRSAATGQTLSSEHVPRSWRLMNSTAAPLLSPTWACMEPTPLMPSCHLVSQQCRGSSFLHSVGGALSTTVYSITLIFQCSRSFYTTFVGGTSFTPLVLMCKLPAA